MIRGLFLLLVMMLGLAAAAVFKGQMHHLRQAMPQALPGWTALIVDDAGLRDGTAQLPARGYLPETQLRWTARPPTRAGWVWDIALTGQGVSLDGQAVLAFWPDRLAVIGVTGTIDLGGLAVLPVPVQGILNIDALRADATGLLSGMILSGEMSGRVPALRIEAADFGQGTVRAELDAEGPWRIDMALEHGISAVTGQISGQRSRPIANVDLVFVDGPALPAELRAMLSASAVPEGQGWRLTVPVPIQ